MDLPLLIRTPDRWVETAFANPASLLSDHAYLERKAASNALELLNRWPEPGYPDSWVPTMTAVARDEALHLHQVTRLMKTRGEKLERLHRSTYASDLREGVRRGHGPKEILDRLLISALIEARSCERFDILGRKCPDKPLARFYRGLCVSELGHYKVFLKLGETMAGKKESHERWKELLDMEARVIKKQPVGSKIHSWVTES